MSFFQKKSCMWPIDIWKETKHHSLSRKCKSKPQGYITSFLVKMPIIKRQQITSVGEDVKKSKPSYTIDRIVNWYQFSAVQLFSHVQLFMTPWTAAHQASLTITNSQSLLKLVSIQLVMPSHHLILCHPLLFLP